MPASAAGYPSVTIGTAETVGDGIVSGGALVASVSAPGGAALHSYAPADTITLTGGTETANAVLTVTATKVISATIAAGGTGGTAGTQTVTGTTGAGGTLFQAQVTVAGGAITAVSSITTAGVYTTNPTTLTAEPVTGAGLVGAQLSVVMGVWTALVTTPGLYTATPVNPVSQGGSSGVGTGASFTMTYLTTALTLFGGVAPVNGWKVANAHPTEDLWVADNGNAAAVASGYRVFAGGGQYATEPGEKPAGIISVFGGAIGHAFTARRW